MKVQYMYLILILRAINNKLDRRNNFLCKETHLWEVSKVSKNLNISFNELLKFEDWLQIACSLNNS